MNPDDVIGHVIRSGTWRDWVPLLPRPVFALPPRHLFVVMVRGTGFSVTSPDGRDVYNAFLTGRIVSAHSPSDADEQTRAAVAADWWASPLGRSAGPRVGLQATHIERLTSRFRLNSSFGLVLVVAEPEDPVSAV